MTAPSVERIEEIREYAARWSERLPPGFGGSTRCIVDLLAHIDAVTAERDEVLKKTENQRKTLVEFETALRSRKAQIWAIKQAILDPDSTIPEAQFALRALVCQKANESLNEAIAIFEARATTAEARVRALEGALRNLPDRVVRDACELPDRNSPEDQPEMLLITGEELHGIVSNLVEAAIVQAGGEPTAQPTPPPAPGVDDGPSEGASISDEAWWIACGLIESDDMVTSDEIWKRRRKVAVFFDRLGKGGA